MRHRHRLIAISLTAVFALVSSGNVVMHRIAAGHHCGCFEHVAIEVEDVSCGCAHHAAENQTVPDEDSRIGAKSECSIGQFYRQANSPVAAATMPFSTDLVELLLPVDAGSVDGYVPSPFWSRGPPATC